MSADGDGPRVKCSLRLEFPSADEAAKVLKSVELDNEDYVRTRLDGRVILAEMSADSLNSLLHTLDDFMSCTSVAEKVVSKKG